MAFLLHPATLMEFYFVPFGVKNECSKKKKFCDQIISQVNIAKEISLLDAGVSS